MRGSVGLSHILKRRTETHLEMLRESLRAAERAGAHIYTSISHHLLGQACFLVGDLEDALTHFRATLAIAEPTGNLFLPGALLWTAEAEARLGRLDAALDPLERSESLIDRLGSLEGLAWFPSRGVAHHVRGLILEQQGQPERVEAEIGETLRLLAEHGYRPDLARAWRALGELVRARGRTAEARDALERAAAIFQDMRFTLELDQTLRLQEGRD